MNQIKKQVALRAEAAADADVDTRPLASQSRRRLIKLGASTVPVLATLTSQSALAGVCISTSAWGSDQISNSESQKARHASKAVEVTTGYTISAWSSNDDSQGTAWAAFKTKFSVTSNPNSYDFALLETKLSSFYGGSYYWNTSRLGFTASQKVVGNLTSDDKGYFLVAMLNYAVGQIPPIDCVTDANWRAIVAGNYPAGTPWTVSQIRQYLASNFIVQP